MDTNHGLALYGHHQAANEAYLALQAAIGLLSSDTLSATKKENAQKQQRTFKKQTSGEKSGWLTATYQHKLTDTHTPIALQKPARSPKLFLHSQHLL